LTQALRRHSAAVGAGWGVTGVLATGLLLAVLAHLTPLWYRQELLRWLAIGLPGGAALGALAGWVWPVPLPARLRRFDSRLQLADRLTTAWELETGQITAPPEMVREQRTETLLTLRSVDSRPAFPPRPTKHALWITVGLGLLLLPAMLLPNPQEAALDRQAALQQAAEAEAARVEQLIETLAENPDLDAETREAALKALQEALSTLQDPRATPEERQTALTEAERQLAALHAPDAEGRVRHLAEAAPLTTEDVVRPLAEALERGDLAAAAAYLNNLATPQGQPLSREEVQQLADAFAQMADSLQDTEPELAQEFRDIANEIYTGDAAGAQAALQKAAETLSETHAANAPNTALEAARAQLQSAQERLDASQGQTASDQPGPGHAGEGAGQDGQSGAEAGSGGTGHHEDAGSSAPYGPEAAARLGEHGGEITLPRPAASGAPQPTTGLQNPARVPYGEVYATYAQAAEAQLSRRALPPTLRSYVREYFSALGE
jgi:hypothetical protein